jgi:hypothetical protein
MPVALGRSRRSRAISNNRDLRISAIAPQSRGCTQMRTCCGSNDRGGINPLRKQSMKKSLPETMFNDPGRSRLTMLRAWVLDNDVTEIEMKERQFWNFAHLQPLAEKPWTTFMGRAISVPDMPLDAQKHLGVFDKRTLAAI